MKTIEEVIEAQARCLKYPNCHFCFLNAGSLCTWIRDALQYLKAYRDDRDDLTAIRAYWAEQQANPPLTWDELKTMEGKPVWLEWSSDGQWVLIAYRVDNDIKFFRYCDDRCFTLTRDEYEPDKWQAYRKERE